ncbi:MAG TPA: DHH family phosphoesterase [Methylomirabilota bacterium]|nr:DHH family phosphoesterase [Methylomirabilota bacterium]
MKERPKIIDRILTEIDKAQTFCVVGHVRPDGDCVGSQLGLALALKGQGKKVVCWNQDPVPEKLGFLDPDDMFQRPQKGMEFDCVIATDAASYERLGTVAEAITARKLLINIDHHASNTRYGDVNWVAPKEPSSGELVFRLIKSARWPITRQIADCLFTAVSTDTGSFQYPSTRPITYHIAGELVKRGADLKSICNEVYHSFPLSRVRLLKHVYNSFKLTNNDQIAYFWLKKADYARTGADENESEGLIDHIRNIEPVVVAAVFEEVGPNLTRISLRSKSPDVNVSDIAALFGGGGHSAAAGARVEGTPMAVQRKVIAAIRRSLDLAAKKKKAA